MFNFAVFVASLLNAAAPPDYVLETKPVQRVRATLTLDVECPKLKADEWLFVIAEAAETGGQTKVKTAVDPHPEERSDESPLKRDLLHVRIKAENEEQQTRASIRVEYQATLWSRRLRRRRPGEQPPRVEPLSDEERKRTLAPLGDMDFRAEVFQEWLSENGLGRRGAESDMSLARRVFQTIKTKFRYEYRSEMDRRAEAVCRAGRSDCGGLSNLFVAAMRAADVPARALYGRWAKSSVAGERFSGEPYHQWHVKAEFWADGVGWIPVDLSSAILHDKSPEGFWFFANDPGDFFTQHIDANLKIDANHFGVKEVHYLQNPVFWVTGGGSVSPTKRAEEWTVRSLQKRSTQRK